MSRKHATLLRDSSLSHNAVNYQVCMSSVIACVRAETGDSLQWWSAEDRAQSTKNQNDATAKPPRLINI